MKHSIYLIMILLLYNCTKGITSTDAISEFEVTFFDYLADSATLYLYTEIEENSNDHSIDSVWAQVYKQNNDLVFYTELIKSNTNDDELQKMHVYSYQGNPGFSSGNYYVKYYFKETSGTNISLTTNIKYLSANQEDSPPKIINLNVPNSISIDSTEWKEISIYLTIFDLNGKDNINTVIYEVKRLFAGCNENVNCEIDLDCHESIIDDEWEWREDWILEFIEYTDNGFIYAVPILMRPLDGRGFSNDANEFPPEDCGNTGPMVIRFTITDRDGNIKMSDEISMEVFAP